MSSEVMLGGQGRVGLGLGRNEAEDDVVEDTGADSMVELVELLGSELV